MTMVDTGLTWGRARRHTLEDDVRAAGLPIINPQQARAHMRQLSHNLRPTWDLKIVGVLVYMIELMTLQWVFTKMRHSEFNDRMLNAMALATVMLAAAIGYKLSADNYQFWIGLPLAMPAMAWVVFLFIQFKFDDLALICAYWEDVHKTGNAARIPDRIMERIAIAEDIPDARVHIRQQGADPFLVVKRGWGPFQQEHIVAAWETGTPMDLV